MSREVRHEPRRLCLAGVIGQGDTFFSDFMPSCPTCATTYPDGVLHCQHDGAALVPEGTGLGSGSEYYPLTASLATQLANPPLAVGQMVGEYRIESKLGEGGFGAVYRAMHPVIGKSAAIKVLNRQYSSDPQMVSRFVAEARAVNQIRHRAIVDIFAFGALADGRQYYVMELLEGEPFDSYLERNRPLAVAVALPLLRTISRALDAAHGAGIVHRDLKPENIFITTDEDGQLRPKLLDFGIAKLLGDGVKPHKTRTGAPMGTPGYMSPEQCRGQHIDRRTDVYAFGVLCHEVLTGALPFDGDSAMDVIVKHMNEAPPRVSKCNPTLNAEMDTPILQMLEKDQSRRPASVGEAFDRLWEVAIRAGHAVAQSGPVHSIPAVTPGAVSRAMTPDKLSPAQLAQFAQAATVHGGGAQKTLSPATAPPRTRSRGRVAWMAAGAVLLTGSIIAGVFAGREARKGAMNSDPSLTVKVADNSSATLPGTPPTGASSHAPAEPAASANGNAVTPTPEPPHAETVDVAVQSPVGKGAIYLGEKKLGDVPGPVKIPKSGETVTLTIRADGYRPAQVKVVPNKDAIVSVSPARAQAPSVVKKPQNDLENPF